jgi:hypothetical protein
MAIVIIVMWGNFSILQEIKMDNQNVAIFCQKEKSLVHTASGQCNGILQ